MSLRAYLVAALAFVAAGALVVAVVQQYRISGLHDRLTAAGTRIELLQQVNASCAADVQAARDGWAEHRRQAAERDAAVRQALAQAEGRAASAETRARQLAQRPPAGADECAAVDDLLGEYLRGRR